MNDARDQSEGAMDDTLWGVMVGSGFGLLSSVVIEHIKVRNERTARWDRDRLSAAADFLAAAKRFEGAQYQRGRRRYDKEQGPEQPSTGIALEPAEEDVRDARNEFEVCTAKARLLLDFAEEEIIKIGECLRKIRDLADEGLPPGRTQKWTAAHGECGKLMVEFTKRVREELEMRANR